MAILNERPFRTREDLRAFEAAMPLGQRLPERSTYDVFAGLAARQAEATAITMLMTGTPDEQPRRVSAAGLLGLINRAANLFATLAGPQQGVAFMLPGLVETHATLWGAEAVGYAVPINFLLQPAAIAALIAASGARVLVALGPHPALDIWPKALAVRAHIPDLVLLRVALPGTPPERGVIDLHDALHGQPADRLIFGAAGHDDDVCSIFHTGGTVGAPKLVKHTHRNELVAAMGAAAMMTLGPDDILASGYPLFHVAGASGGLGVFLAGAQLLILSPGGLRNPAMVANYWRIVERYGVTRASGVPTSFGAILDVPLDGADIGTLRSGLTGGAMVPPSIHVRFRDVTGRTLHNVYGMTEAAGAIATDPFGHDGDDGSAGWALPYTEVTIRRLGENGMGGAVCAEGEIGVLTVRGPHVAPGYLDPERNRGVFDDGTLNTGDLAYADEQGRIHIVGRAKDLIIRSGHNIDPQMIEDAMMTHPAVLVAAAVGQPDAYAGELPVCFVQLRPEANATEAELLDHARAAIAERPAWPRHVHVVPSIPLTAVGKIYKPHLRCEATTRMVTTLLRERHGIDDVVVETADRDQRGLRVTVRLPSARAHHAAAIEATLADYLFETVIDIATRP